MSNLSLFGQTLSNVTAFTLPTTGGSTATYTEGGGSPTLETITKTYTPTTSQQTETITASQGYDGIEEVDVTVNAVPTGEIAVELSAASFYTENNARKWRLRCGGGVVAGENLGTPGYIADETWIYSNYRSYNALPTGTSVTPTESSQTIGGQNYMMEGAVTVNAVPSNYVGSGITQRTSSDLTANNLTVTAPAGYYSSAATKTLSDQNLVAGNIKKDVTIFGTTGTYEGGGSSGMVVATATATPATASSSISFTGLQGEPTSFYVVSASDLATGASPYKTASVVFDGTNVIGQYITNTNNAQMTYSSSAFSKSYSSGTLTITGTASNFQANQYKLVYTYGGNSANIGTESVQVGSGATSITFTGLSDEPTCFACIFTDNIGTSSGYTRTLCVASDGTNTYGMEMGSSALATSNWSASYSNGSLTISSQSTSAGGYFHQPGYYELVYATGEAIEIETEPLSVTENGTYTAPRGKAYTPVSVNVSGGGSATVATKTTTLSAVGQTLTFTGLSGTPKMWAVRCTTQVSSSGSTTYYYLMDAVYNGTSVKGNCFRIGSTRRIQNVTSGLSQSYSGGTLTITGGSSSGATPGQWYNGDYELVYVY